MVDDMIVRHASCTGSLRTYPTGARLPLRVWLLLMAMVVAAIGAAPASASERATYRTQALPAAAPQASAARADGSPRATTPRRTTIDLRTARRFSMVGLRWASARAEISGSLRAQRTDGSWTRWMELEGQTGRDGITRGADGAEAIAGERRAARTGLLGATEPLWTGPARRLQIRLDGPRPRGLRAAFVDVTGAPSPRATAARAAAKRQDDALAGIQPRTAWDPDNECAPRGTPGMGSVQAVVVHHTVGSNDYTQAQVPAILLGICKFHRNGNGWNDIGYNVLVDRFGGAWEGRAGGITLPVVGAQAQGFNAVTSGISMLGDFQTAAPSPAQLATVGRVAAWRLAVAGVPRSGTVDLTSAGGSLSRFKEGKVATLPRVMGHRDVGLTECPGNLAYPLLDQVRSAVAAANPVLPVNLPAAPAPTPLPVKITIDTERTLTAGADAVVRGTATQGGTPLRAATVALQVASGSDWQTVARDRTTTAGRYAFRHRFSRSWKLRVVRTDGDGGTSSTVALSLVPRLRLTVPKRMKVNQRIVLRGTVAPGRGPVTLTIERRSKSGRYVAGPAVPVKQSGRRLSVAITPHSATLYRFRLSIAASEFNTAARSPLAYGRAVTGQTSGGASVSG